MTARLLTGRPVADAVWRGVEERVGDVLAARGRPPELALVLGDDPAAHAYADQIGRAFGRRRLGTTVHRAPAAAELVRDLLARLSGDSSVDGVLVLTPLPGGVAMAGVIDALDPAKDVDGQHPASLGRLARRQPGPVPATALGGLRLLDHYGIPVAGRRAVVVGRSSIVGMPLALLLLTANATVTVCHSATANLEEETHQGDIVCVAVGRPGFLRAQHVRPGATVLDFGTNALPDGSLVGDVQTDAVAAVAGAITPVPHGTGPVTTAVLAEQTTSAALGRLG